MHKRTRLLLPAAALSVTALALTACASPSATEEPAAAAESATVVVENAKPTLVLVEREGESSYQEDTEVDREAVEVRGEPRLGRHLRHRHARHARRDRRR